MADIRTITVPAIWADNAQTTIPNPPVTGQSYRQAVPDPNDWKIGQAYDTLADSARWNELMYILTALMSELEKNGVLPYSQSTNYNTGALTIGQDNVIYQAKLPSGPANGGAQPLSNRTYWTKPLVQVQYGSSTSINVPTGGGQITLKIKSGGGLGVDSGGVYVNPDTFSSEIIDELLQQLRVPKWLTENKNWYVNPITGSDRNDGETQQTAFKTINYGLKFITENFNLAAYSGILMLAPGSYDEIVKVPNFTASTGVLGIFSDDQTTARVRAIQVDFKNNYLIGGITLDPKGRRGIGSGITTTALVINPGATVIARYLSIDMRTPPVAPISRSSAIQCNGGDLVFDRGCAINFSAEALVYGALIVQNFGKMTIRYDMSINGALKDTSAATLRAMSLAQFIRSKPSNSNNPIITGTVTVGKRFTAETNSVVSVGGDQNYFPGGVAGTLYSGAQYN